MTQVKLDRRTDALILVDVQPAFMPGGGLAVEGGDEVVPVARKLMSRFDIRFATLDRHPVGHVSFASSHKGLSPMFELTHGHTFGMSPDDILSHRFNLGALRNYMSRVGAQVLWPDHAVIGTPEAELHPAFKRSEFLHVQEKGLDIVCDSYSGFYDNLRRPTGFEDIVAASGATRIFVCGLAFDFCVGWTALDATHALPGREIFVVEDACRSVNMPGSVAKMAQDLVDAGVRIVHSSQITDN